jgi:hypothetical protein
MRRTLSDDDGTLGGEFERALTGAQRSLFRFEQQRSYAVDDEAGLFAAFRRRGELIEPNQAPGLRAWFEQVHEQTQRGIYVERVRVVDDPITEYQRWLQFVDRWNREAGEAIEYLPRRRYQEASINPRARLWTPFEGAAGADWWLIDDRLAALMYFDAAGERTKVELTDDGMEIARAVIFRAQAQNVVRDLRRRQGAEAA